MAHLAPGCHHKVFGAASNVVYSYAGPSLTGVNHRAGNMDLGMGWSLMSGGEKSRRQRKFLFQRRTFDRGHWLYFELMVDMQKSQPLGTVGLADRPTWKPLPNCFFLFFVCFSGLHDGTFNTRWCRAHQHSPLEARRFPTSLPDQRSTSG